MKEKLNIRLVSLLIIAAAGFAGWYSAPVSGEATAVLLAWPRQPGPGRPDRAARFVGLTGITRRYGARIRYADLLKSRPEPVKNCTGHAGPSNFSSISRRTTRFGRVVSTGLKLRLFDDTLRHAEILQSLPEDGPSTFSGLCLRGRGKTKPLPRHTRSWSMPYQIDAYVAWQDCSATV